MFDTLKEINLKPEPFELYTADKLWTDDHTSSKMLQYHLNESIDLSSRNKDFITRSVDWIVSYFKINENSKIADFGCGPGLYTTSFAENKAIVTGIDFSKRSITYAKETAQHKNLDIKYFHQNYLEFETDEKFDLITMIFCDFCALSPFQRKTLLEKFYKFLKPHGKILLDVHSLNTFNNREEITTYEFNQLDNFWAAEDYYAFLNIFKYSLEKVTLDKYVIFEKKQTRIIYNWLQYFNANSLTKEFEDCGFKVENLYSDVAGSTFSENSPDIAIIAGK